MHITDAVFELKKLQAENARLEDELAECKAEVDFNIQRVNDITHDAEVELKEVYSERDALRARCERLESAIRTHQSNVWGTGKVDHYEDVTLYKALEVPK